MDAPDTGALALQASITILLKTIKTLGFLFAWVS